MKTIFLVLLLFASGCAREAPENIVPEAPLLLSAKPERAPNAVADQLEGVDARRDGHSPREKPAGALSYPIRAKPDLRIHAHRRRVEPKPEPVGDDRSEPEPARRAVEADANGARAYVVEPGRARPRWEVEAQLKRCESRPTRWARENCMAGE